MRMRTLGGSGLKVSEVGIGCNNFGGRMDQAATQAVVDAAIGAGINFFDTADIYGNRESEVQLGRALAGRRHDVVVATKFGIQTGPGPNQRGGSRGYIMAAVDASLKRLGTDYIDLYQMHRPDAETPIEETLRALDDLVRAGKVRYLGSSNYSGWQIADADWTARSRGLDRFVTAQNHLSLLERGAEAEVLPACRRFGVGMLPYFPLASGLLTGKYVRNEAPPAGTRLAGPAGARSLNDRNFEVVEKLSAFAAARGHSLLDLAFGWLLSQPVMTSVIAGATKPEQVLANAAAAKWRLSDEEMREVGQLARK
jgi:aryl-alcohol dehydrogenase-like predicted oxidoreductase